MASDAGFVEYPSLPGKIKTGCVNSPAFKSRFCMEHCSRSCVSKSTKLSESDLHNHNPAASVESSDKSPSETGESIIGMILEKRETRGGTYYKVLKN